MPWLAYLDASDRLAMRPGVHNLGPYLFRLQILICRLQIHIALLTVLQCSRIPEGSNNVLCFAWALALDGPGLSQVHGVTNFNHEPDVAYAAAEPHWASQCTKEAMLSAIRWNFNRGRSTLSSHMARYSIW